jgi:hypothetical protein
MMVPVTALIATTTAETSSVNLMAAHASGPDTASQNPLRPPSSECTTTAARGIRTIRLR